MQHKTLPCPQRLRRIPHQFSWIDQRFVRDGAIRRCDTGALALYLFLVTVADANGLSYYSARSIADFLSITPERLTQARHTLMQAELIAFAQPFYQVLSLDTPVSPVPARPRRPQSLRSLVQQALEKKL